MAPSAAEAQGLVRTSKHPKSTKYGRQNPIAERWNSDEQLLIWREKWADVTNKYLAQYPWIDARIDHRSHAARGLDEQPTIHEGVTARALEKKVSSLTVASLTGKSRQTTLCCGNSNPLCES